MTCVDIQSLAVIANEGFHRATIAGRMLNRKRAAEAGSALIAIETALVHGEFESWVHRNFDGTIKDAKSLMNFARSVSRQHEPDPLRGGTLQAFVERLSRLKREKRGARAAYRAAAAQEGFRRAAGQTNDCQRVAEKLFPDEPQSLAEILPTALAQLGVLRSEGVPK